MKFLGQNLDGNSLYLLFSGPVWDRLWYFQSWLYIEVQTVYQRLCPS